MIIQLHLPQKKWWFFICTLPFLVLFSCKGPFDNTTTHPDYQKDTTYSFGPVPDTVRYIPYRKGDKYFFVDREKKGPYGPGVARAFDKELEFDMIWPFNEFGYCKVKDNNKYGMMDTTGKLIVPVTYPKIRFYYSSFVALHSEGGVKTIVDKRGNPVYMTTNKISMLDSNFMAIKLRYRHQKLVRLPEGKTIVPYGKYGYFQPPRGSDLIAVSKIYREESKNKKSMARKKRFGYIDTTGKLVIDLEYDYTGSCINGMGSVEKNGKYGFINAATREQVIPCKYEQTFHFKDGYARVKDSVNWKIIDKKGDVVVEYPYIGYAYNVETDIIPVAKSDTGKYGIMNARGELVVPLIYDEIDSYAVLRDVNNFITAKKDGKWGVIDRFGNVIIPFLYAHENKSFCGVFFADNHRFLVKKNGKYGLVNYKNEFIIPREYEVIEDKYGVYRTLKGFFDYQGNAYFED
jgi:hypothetical protein